MTSHQIIFKQKFNKSLPFIWEFFSSPYNLEKITPNNMAFEVTSTPLEDQKMYPGMIITYKVSPLLGVKLNWMTEITEVEHEKYFIDEQRFGPFKFWHHQHHFKATDKGVEMTDILTYGLPLGFLGDIAHALIVKNKIKEIFKFREEKTKELFG
jgi:ligand-binding SRPBCC domain-containing protein